MTSIRLAVYMKDGIRQALMDRRFKEVREAGKKEWAKLGDALYKHLYPDAIRRKMKALPAGWLPKSTGVRFKFGGDFERVIWGDDRLIAACHENAAAAIFTANDTFTDTYRELKAAGAKRREQEQQLKAEINAALNSATTIHALIAKWPEVAPFCEPYLGKAREKAQLPTIQTAQLNSALDLPVTADKPAREKKPKPVGKVVKKSDLARKVLGIKSPSKKARR